MITGGAMNKSKKHTNRAIKKIGNDALTAISKDYLRVAVGCFSVGLALKVYDTGLLFGNSEYRQVIENTLDLNRIKIPVSMSVGMMFTSVVFALVGWLVEKLWRRVPWIYEVADPLWTNATKPTLIAGSTFLGACVGLGIYILVNDQSMGLQGLIASIAIGGEVFVIMCGMSVLVAYVMTGRSVERRLLQMSNEMKRDERN